MSLVRDLLFKGRRVHRALVALVVYMLCAVIYSSLPWSVREPIYRRAPKVDKALRTSGYKVLQGFDELALWGKDRTAPFEERYRGEHLFAGKPSQGMQLLGRVKVLENEGYVAGYSESRKDPLWVGYRVYDVPALSSGKRPSRFSMDERTRSRVKHDDYTNSGFDRGHMAPNYAIATRYGTAAQRETFKMTNVIPQTPAVNQHLWKDLEMRVAKRYGRYFSEVWVLTGPVFREPVDTLKSGVAVPSDYYKILVDVEGDEVRALAFLVSKECPPYTRIKTQLVSIDEIEELTGLDFFTQLPEEAQAQLEAEAAGRLWPWMIPAVHYHFKGETR